MKRLILLELMILSDRERKARRISFDPHRTIIFGGNETGKSSLLKSIYYTFGAEAAKQHPRWKSAAVKTLVRFSLDGTEYLLLRDGGYFAIFLGNGTFIRSFTRVVEELTPFLASLFDFGMVLVSRNGLAETPPPAYLLLPFYMDQDSSWQNPWSGFSNLWQYTSWKEPLTDYHTGVRDNNYYRLEARYITAKRDLGEIQTQIRGLDAVAKNLEIDTKNAKFSLKPDAFDDQVNRLLQRSSILREQENAFKEKLTSVTVERNLQRTRLAIAEKALGEISGDFRFLSTRNAQQVDCPTCGKHYENDFAARFSIATDEDRVAEFITHIRAEVTRLDGQVSSIYEDFSVTRLEAQRIEDILAEKQGELTFADVIESEGRRAADSLLQGRLAIQREIAAGRQQEVDRAAAEVKGAQIKSKSIGEEVLTEYRKVLRQNFKDLDIQSYGDGLFRSLNPSLIETGSALPRALLGYQMALLSIICKRSPATVFPIVIDSPNQQAQTDPNLNRILQFLINTQPSGSQMILGLEKDLGLDLGGKMIYTEEKHSLLRSSDFEEVRTIVYGLLKSSI